MDSHRFRDRMIRSLFVPAMLCLALPAARPVVAQESRGLTIDWMFSGGAERVGATPRALWVSDGRLLLYDTLHDGPGGAFRFIDPASGGMTTALDLAGALESLRDLAGARATPPALPWPESFDAAGQEAVFLFGGDVFLLDLRSARFERITESDEEEVSATVSPDGRRVAYVRENDMYVYDRAGKKEVRLTRDGSATTLN
ncbi:MAG TPA: DPP IV N-terminal domain-containing protein, partial [Bacteroidota bacterium]|nr:DPP IV N-terminal domain-containing protein [Bacteroidota bacterium]